MFSAELINEPCADPGVYVKFKHRNEAFLFDVGNLCATPSRKILRLSNIFVSHTHMDHFIGFDYILRICLGRDRHLSLFGPPGFISNVESKIGAYSWNLVGNYNNDFIIDVTEVHENKRITKRFECRNAFSGEITGEKTDTSAVLLDREDCIVKTAFLDHRIPSLAFSLKEKQHINIMKNALEELGLPQGDWLADLKDRIRHKEPDDTPVSLPRTVKTGKGGKAASMPLGRLRESIVMITPGQKLAYVADAVYSEENARRIIDLAESADILFIEAPFLDEEAEQAAAKYHLTARQAGELARKAGVKRFVLFHFSPKYRGQEFLLEEEALEAFVDLEAEIPCF